MNLNKSQIRIIIALVVCLVVYNLLAFLIPFAHTVVFWIGYVFGIIAIAVAVLIFIVAFSSGSSAKSRFYGFPIARVGMFYVGVQIVLSFIAMAIAFLPKLPAWPFILVFILLLAAAILGTISTDSARDVIEQQDTKLSKDVSTIRALRSLGNSLVAQCTDEAARKDLKKLSDTLNYCDPVSNDATTEAEGELKALLQEIQRAIVDGDNESISPLCKKASYVLSERNRLCKLNK